MRKGGGDGGGDGGGVYGGGGGGDGGGGGGGVSGTGGCTPCQRVTSVALMFCSGVCCCLATTVWCIQPLRIWVWGGELFCHFKSMCLICPSIGTDRGVPIGCVGGEIF